jgi:hypothetical protein
MGEKTPEFNEKNKKLMNHSPLIQSAAGNIRLFHRAIHTAIILLQKSGQNKPGKIELLFLQFVFWLKPEKP